MKSITCILLCLFAIALFTGFKSNKQKTKVTFNLLADTVYFAPEDYNQNGTQFSFDIKNLSKENIVIPKDDFMPGYKDEVGCEYYLEHYRLEDDIKVPFKHRDAHVGYGEYLGPYVTLKPGSKQSYGGYTGHLYAFPQPGKYYFRVVFMNKYGWIGQSNVDSVVVLDKIETK